MQPVLPYRKAHLPALHSEAHMRFAAKNTRAKHATVREVHLWYTARARHFAQSLQQTYINHAAQKNQKKHSKKPVEQTKKNQTKRGAPVSFLAQLDSKRAPRAKPVRARLVVQGAPPPMRYTPILLSPNIS